MFYCNQTDKRLKCLLNVGGNHYEVLWKTFEALPNSRLGQLRYAKNSEDILNLCDDYNKDKNEFFFDRQSDMFTTILNFYRIGKLHLFDEICVISFLDELKYWGISESEIETCCQQKYYEKKHAILEEIKTEKILLNDIIYDESKSCGYKLKRKLWDLMENPQSSTASRIMATLSIFFIIFSTISFTINTIPEIHRQKLNVTNFETRSLKTTFNTELVFEVIEAVCVSWFTIEYSLRCWSSPDKKKFFFDALNYIDIIAIVPYFASIFLSQQKYFNIVSFNTARRVLQVFRVLRIFRILKLARHSIGLKSLGLTFKKSYTELAMLMMFLAIGVLLFSSLAYFAERDHPSTKFTSIPAAFWWAIITMTTVGYGDIYPETNFGKIIGSVCCISGVLVISLPIPIVVNNFSKFYSEQRKLEKRILYIKSRNTKEIDIDVSSFLDQIN